MTTSELIKQQIDEMIAKMYKNLADDLGLVYKGPQHADLDMLDALSYSMIRKNDTSKQKFLRGFEFKEKVCECGKEKHGFAQHSTWCDMHEDKQ